MSGEQPALFDLDSPPAPADTPATPASAPETTHLDDSTSTGIPIHHCDTCHRRHPITRRHCPTCGLAHLFPHRTHRKDPR